MQRIDWRKALAMSGHTLDEFVDALAFRLKRRTGFSESIGPLPFRTFGSSEKAWLRGRVLKFSPEFKSSPNDSIWRNLLASYRRFHSREVPGARVLLEFGGSALETVADAEGYFQAVLYPSSPLGEGPWHEGKATVLWPGTGTAAGASAPCHVLIPVPSAQFGVISDIDDTVLVTQAGAVAKMIASTLFKNAHTRLPFPGVAAFYRALQAGPEPRSKFNPIFYVSSGPWNLYDLLRDFFEANGIPAGPLCLQDYGFDRDKFVKASHQHHKLRSIFEILETCANLPFILLGDSGQEDPEIYIDVLRQAPSRIKAIYIRDAGSAERAARTSELCQEAKRLGSEMILIQTTFEAAEHALERGWISRAGLEEIRIEMQIDEPGFIADLAGAVETSVETKP
jgi:phosphatidate phosphatase APP1